MGNDALYISRYAKQLSIARKKEIVNLSKIIVILGPETMSFDCHLIYHENSNGNMHTIITHVIVEFN